MTAMRPTGKRQWMVTVTLMLGIAMLQTGCTADHSGEPLPPSGPVVEALIAGHELELERSMPAGRVVVRLTNAGDERHQLTVLRLAEDSPPIEEQLEPGDYEPPEVVARVAELKPGETGMVAVELTAGERYALVDLSESTDARLHARLGVATEFRARARNGTATPRSPDADGPAGPPAGEGTR